MRSHAYAEMCEQKICEFSHMRHNFRVCNFEKAIICGQICNMHILQHMRSHVRRIFSYNRYPYKTCNGASVLRALLAPEILNESFLKCRYFTALLATVLMLM